MSANSTHELQYEDITIQLNLRLKPDLSEEDVSKILASKSLEIRDLINEYRQQSLRTPQQPHTRLTKPSSSAVTLKKPLEFVFEPVVPESAGKPAGTSKKRKHDADQLAQSIRRNSSVLGEKCAASIKLGGRSFQETVIHRTEWLSTTVLAEPRGEGMGLSELTQVYESYTDWSSLRLQRARLVQCFLALAMSRSGAGRPSNTERKKKETGMELGGCDRTKARRACAGKILIELMNMLNDQRAYIICVALAANPDFNVMTLGRETLKGTEVEVAGIIKAQLDQCDWKPVWQGIGPDCWFDPADMIRARDLPYSMARDTLGLKVPKPQDLKKVAVPRNSTGIEQSLCLPHNIPQRAEDNICTARGSNNNDPSGCRAQDWDDIVGLGVDFDVLETSMDFIGLLSETAQAADTSAYHTLRTEQEPLFDIPRNSPIPNAPLSGAPNYASEAPLTDSCSDLAFPSSGTQDYRWDGLESLGIDVYPIDQGFPPFSMTSDLVTQIE